MTITIYWNDGHKVRAYRSIDKDTIEFCGRYMWFSHSPAAARYQIPLDTVDAMSITSVND